MRRLTLALVLLALTPAGGFAQASSAYLDDLPAPPHLELCSPCFDATLQYFILPRDLPSYQPDLEAPLGIPTPPTDPWDNLRQLRQGQNIRILDANSRKVNARFLGLSGDVLEVQANGKALTLAREHVVMVSLPPPSKAKRILLGVLGGALTSYNAWAEADRRKRHCWDDEGYYCEKEDGLSKRSAVISTAAGAAISGVAAGFVKQGELVIYFNGSSRVVHNPAFSDSADRSPEKARQSL